MPIEPFWTFFSFLDRGTCVIHKWMNDIGMKTKARVKIETRFRYLSLQQTWEPNFAKKLNGYDDIYEIRIRHEGVQFRPLGCFDPHSRVFTLLIGAVEKDSNFRPRNAPEVAASRRKLISCNRSLIHEYESYIAPVKKSDER